MARRIRSDPTRRGVVLGAVAGAGLLAAPTILKAQSRLTVFAAASLKPALDEIAADRDVALSYGGSGAIARQIAAGAPADAVILAATDWMDWLTAQGALSGDAVAVAGNRLVLAGPPDGEDVALTPDAISAALDGGRLAMGDPMSVPAGRYAQQAFETLGLWPGLSDRLILTEDVRAALAYVARGDVALGAVYRSDTLGTGVSVAATLPETAHAPIVYPGATVGFRRGAGAFLERVRTATDVFAAHGFAPAPTA